MNTPPRISNLSIVTHLIGVYKLWYEFLPHLPKDSRYALGTKIDALFIETAEALFIAAYMPKEQKVPHIQKAAAKLDLAKFFLQVAWEINALDNKKYALISDKLADIGKMLGGWLRQTVSRSQPAAP